MHYEVNDGGDDRDAEDGNGEKVKQGIETGVIGKRLRLLLSHDAGAPLREFLRGPLPKWTRSDEQV
jgi:hypothetical protein